MTPLISILVLLLPCFVQRAVFFGQNASGAPPSPPSFTHVQSCGNQNSGSVSAATVTCGSPIGAGHLLYICLSEAGASVPTVTWSGDSGTFTNDANFQNYAYNNGGNTFSASCYYVLVAGGGGSTLTATASLFFPALTVDEFSYTGGPIFFDTSSAGASAHGTPTSSNITTAINGELILGYSSTSGTVTAGSGYTGGGSSAFPSLQEYQVQISAGTINATFVGTVDYAAHVAAFK